MRFTITGEVVHWRGPSPYHFVLLPDEPSEQITAMAASTTYGWGMIPVGVRIGDSCWRTSLFPREGGYALPLRDSIRTAHCISVGDTVTAELTVFAEY